MSEKIVLIDGHSILNRAFYGVPDLTNAEGLHTNAVYGFLNIMFKILDEEKPEYLTVTFDVHAPTFRHEMYAEYKGTRKPMAEELRQQVPVIKEVVKKKIPFLGICLGLQLLFERSDEAPGVEGLGILPGEILRIPASGGLKIPHMGWNSLHLEHNGRLFRGIEEQAYVYFVHSFYLKAAEEEIVKASTEYGVHIHASVEKDNVFACQFHPEKSGDVGLRILKNFVELG